MENLEFKPRNAEEREPHLPLINTEEQRFIEDTGGEYSGYIRSDDGERRYEQFRVDRRAHYDESRRTVVETYIATETIDLEGEKELRGPEDASGFSILIKELSASGEELMRPAILMVRPTDFQRPPMSAAELLELAPKVHVLAAQSAPAFNTAEISARVQDFLRSMGWQRSS